MNPSTDQCPARIRRLLAGAGIVAVVIAVLLGFFQPAAILPAYRFAVFTCFAPAIGSVLFALVHRCTGGKWGEVLQPFLMAGSRLAPWIWLLVVPLLFFIPPAAPAWPHYDSRLMITVRAAGYAVILFGVATALTRRRAGWVGPVGLVVLVFTLHLLADDWLETLEPGWHSTAFPLVWMMGQAVTGLSCAVLAALACGISPAAPSATPARSLGVDWGNLLLTAMLFWCYVMFAQFLIIWAGNLPREISWFVRRTQGGWVIVPVLLVMLHFIVPLALLLSRRLKRSRALGAAAALLLVAQFIFVAWLILPAFPASNAGGVALAFLLGVGALAFFLRRYLTLAARQLASS